MEETKPGQVTPASVNAPKPAQLPAASLPTTTTTTTAKVLSAPAVDRILTAVHGSGVNIEPRTQRMPADEARAFESAEVDRPARPATMRPARLGPARLETHPPLRPASAVRMASTRSNASYVTPIAAARSPGKKTLDRYSLNADGTQRKTAHGRSNASPKSEVGADEELFDVPPRRVVIASDHRGFEAKQRLQPQLEQLGFELIDLGCHDADNACDYPDYAAPAAKMVAEREVDVAILLDGSGIGMGIVANKVPGVRAATCHDEFTARIAREHNHCNVLCVGTDLVSERALQRVVEIFLTTTFAAGRHVRRVAKLMAIETESLENAKSTSVRASV
jgi:ribose 5-phosphate isomerase B